MPSPISVSPSSATLYSNLPTTFVVSGGNGAYFVTSSNQGVVPNVPFFGNSFVVVPNTVAADTPVTLSVGDTGTSIPVAVALVVKPITTAPLSAKPGTIAFQGIAPGTCASGIDADVIVSGGNPPYAISQPGVFNVFPLVVTTNPGRFTVRATGQCSAGAQIAVVDTAGGSATVTASNILSTAPAPTPPAQTAFAVSPTTVTLTGCKDVARILIVGGSGSYIVASGNDSVLAGVESNNTGAIRRAPALQAPATVLVAFSDGVTVRNVTVTLETAAQGLCPSP